MESENKALVTRLVSEVWNERDLDVADEILAADYEGHGYGGGDVDRDGYKQFVDKHFDLFPDLEMSVDETIAEDEKVVARWTITGTQEGPVLGIEPTGKEVAVPGVTVYRVEDGRVVEDWNTPDPRALMKQLGVGPEALTGQA